jgi:heme exporter protein C
MKKLAAPAYFYKQTTRLVPWLSVGVLLFLSYGLIAGLFFAPVDYQQQQAVKIIYVHVPCAILSLSIYTIIGCMSFIWLVWKIKIADVIAKVSAPFGASVTALALITGSLWGKPMWGTWWVWDARLTSELILLFLYFGYLGLRSAIRDPQIAASVCAVLAVVGLIDIPIIHYSVDWWHTLHQGATISKFAKPAIAAEMLYPLLSMLVACYLFYLLLVCINARSEILWRERKNVWVQGLILGAKSSV